MQGALADDWATFDGRLFVVPKNSARLRNVRVGFTRPASWSVASALRQDGDWHYFDTFEQKDMYQLLDMSCFGVGRVEQQTRRFGEMDVRVAVYSGWNAKDKTKLFDSTFAILDYFHETLDFDLGAPYLAVWSPKFERYRVYGGSHSNGTCQENPGGALRPLQVMTHRVAHSMDKYKPSGLHVSNPENYWFREAWPSYMEVVATEAAGVAPDQGYFNALYNTYKVGRRTNIERDIPLTKEKDARGHVVEFVHYKKGPLVAKMLAHQIEVRSGRTIEQFMRGVWAEYGFYEKRFDVKQELERFTGSSFDDFWKMIIVSRGTVIPVWEEYVTDKIRKAANAPVGAWVGGTPVSRSYLHYLAALGGFDTFAEIRQFLVAEEARRRALDARGVVLYPEIIREHMYGMPGDDRHAIAVYEASYPLDPAESSRFETDLTFEVNSRHYEGRTFGALLEAEQQYLAALPESGLSGVELRAKRKSGKNTTRLGFGTDALLELVPRWRSSPRPTRVELLVDGQVSRSWELGAGDGQAGSVPLTAKDRPANLGLVAFRVIVEGRPPVTRVYWQRGKEPADRSVAGHGLLSDKLLKSDPDNPEAWYRNGMQLSAKGNHVSALSSYLQAVEMDPADAGKWLKYGETLVALDRRLEALDAFDSALELDPGYVAASGNKAVALAELGRRDEALAVIERFIKRSPKPPDGQLWRARVYDHLGEIEQAAEVYRAYADAQPKRFEGWQGLGHALFRLQQYPEAIEALDAALALNSRDRQSMRERGLAQHALEKKVPRGSR
jgi:Tfp pilus assembly protein PilF